MNDVDLPHLRAAMCAAAIFWSGFGRRAQEPDPLPVGR